jgi:hypothetical protein
MSLLDCLADGGKRCGTLGLFANLSPDPVSLEIQYPGNDNVWYTIGAFRAGEMFQAGPANLLFPGESLLRAVATEEKKTFLVGKITQGEQNLFYLPNNAFS